MCVCECAFVWAWVLVCVCTCVFCVGGGGRVLFVPVMFAAVCIVTLTNYEAPWYINSHTHTHTSVF